MTTNFFSQFAAIAKEGNYRLGISVTEKGIIVDIMPVTKYDAPLIEGVPPLIFPVLEPQKLDQVFFNDIQQPVAEVREYLSNKNQFQKALKDQRDKLEKKQDTASNAASSKTSDNAVEKPPKPKPPKYAEAMKLVEKLEKEEKYGQALYKLPKVTEFPAFQKEIEEKTAAIQALWNAKQPSMFPDDELTPKADEKTDSQPPAATGLPASDNTPLPGSEQLGSTTGVASPDPDHSTGAAPVQPVEVDVAQNTTPSIGAFTPEADQPPATSPFAPPSSVPQSQEAPEEETYDYDYDDEEAASFALDEDIVEPEEDTHDDDEEEENE